MAASAGQRNEPGQRSGEEQHREHGEGVDHARHRGHRSAANAGRGAGNRAGGRQPSEEWRQDIGDALRHQFHIRIVLIAAHAVGDHRRHQRLNRSQQGHRDGGGNQRPHRGVFEHRHVETGKARRDAPEARPDGLDRQMQQVDGNRGRDQGHDVAGNPRQKANRQHDQQQRGAGQQGGGQRNGVRTPQHHPHAPHKIPGNRPGVQSEKVFDLGAGNEDGDAVGKAHDHRAGNELDRRAQAGGSQHHEQAAGHDGAHQQAIEAIARQNAGDDHDKRARSGRQSGCASRPGRRWRIRLRPRCRDRPLGAPRRRWQTPSRAARRPDPR